MQRRRTFLQYLWDNGVDQYQDFTAMVNRYYARPHDVMAEIAGHDADPDPMSLEAGDG
jgi:flagellar protein FlaI